MQTPALETCYLPFPDHEGRKMDVLNLRTSNTCTIFLSTHLPDRGKLLLKHFLPRRSFTRAGFGVSSCFHKTGPETSETSEPKA